ncbi:MAG: RHS repeat-associated core domain-containing protein [Fimbriimonadaceae bacterium]
MFARLNKQELVSNVWVNSKEEVRYKKNGLGQLKEAQFAMTPQGGASNYDSTDAPLSYVSANYDYDSAGRTLSVKHYWNQLVSGNYAVEAIRGSSAAYATDLGLKSSTSFLTRATAGSPNWSTVRTENYGYDQHFDYLTSVDYNDGLANEVQTWDYDAAGNRISASANPGTWTYDNLNRMSASPGVLYFHDMVGNRTAKSVNTVETRYEWDSVNRMTKIGKTSGDVNFKYRADGMRVRKSTATAVESVFYDGQMPVETFEDFVTGNDVLTRNFVGARGIEAMFTTANNSTTAAYPLYDTHGNMVATLSKNTAGTSWSVGDERSYDVWGSVRSGATTGGPKGRYVANLGHVQDDESGLIYMRARYYEPETGRFVSEDPAHDGSNWYVYCKNCPINFWDANGKNAVAGFIGFLVGFIIGFMGEFVESFFGGNPPPGAGDALRNGLIGAIMGFGAEVGATMALAAGNSALLGGIGGAIGAIAAFALAVYIGKMFFWLGEAMFAGDYGGVGQDWTQRMPIPWDPFNQRAESN